MRPSGTHAMLPVAFIAGAAVATLLFAAAIGALAMSRGDWGMGNWGMGRGHMNGMMGGGVNSSNAAPSVGSKSEAIAIRNFAFAPGNLRVPVGATVTWTNYDDVPHTATAKDGSWDTGLLNKSGSNAITFSKPGDYEYYCNVHPNMIARLTVQ
jgi:plastocyanin